ncbi:uncharacterized protein LOC123404634 [Hordeum vulgare subsp. vulgare]|nr:uncharacterized protein LOC123404634 [Hordeum vulgare subsp. vulgare]
MDNTGRRGQLAAPSRRLPSVSPPPRSTSVPQRCTPRPALDPSRSSNGGEASRTNVLYNHEPCLRSRSFSSPPPPRKSFPSAPTAAVPFMSMDTSKRPGVSGCYTTPTADRLWRQRSSPAAVVSAFLPCGGHGGQARRNIRSARLSGKVGHRNGDDGQEAELGSVAWPGGMGFTRLLWMRVVGKVMSRMGSSVKEQYAQEDYEQNFDEGGAAGEPENLPRSFSARYARRRPAGMAFTDVAHRRPSHPDCETSTKGTLHPHCR